LHSMPGHDRSIHLQLKDSESRTRSLVNKTHKNDFLQVN
jgi:hypothetical protein